MNESSKCRAYGFLFTLHIRPPVSSSTPLLTVASFACATGAPDITHASGLSLFPFLRCGEKQGVYNCTIWEAGRATSAAPTFFKRIKIGPTGSGVEYVDAGLGCNNPVKQVVAEAARVFGEDA